MNKEKLKHLLENTKALEDAMKFIYRSTDPNAPFPFSNYKELMRKYNDIALRVSQEIGGDILFDIFNLENVRDWSNTYTQQQKMYFDTVLANVALMRSTIENRLDIKSEQIINLKNFMTANLRKAVMREPKDEQYIQDVIEQLLIGKGLTKGIDYDREVGRVRVSIKEYKPDFIFPQLDLALEVKLSKSKAKSKVIVDEINADIKSYSKGYTQLLFLVYDMGTIRDETEFKNDLDNKGNIQILIIKH